MAGLGFTEWFHLQAPSIDPRLRSIEDGQMPLHVMLSLDFSDAKDNRYHFNNFLEAKGWKKLTAVDTVWHREYAYSQSNAFQVVYGLKQELTEAANEFKPNGIEYVAQIGNAEPIKCGVVKTRYGYEHVTR